MAFLEFKNVRIAGIAAGVPKQIFSNLHPDESDCISSEYAPEDFVKVTGVKERRVSDTLTTSDLCYEAAEKLIADLKWNKEEIGAIVFVSQTADYWLPATSLLSTGEIKKALLLVGDAKKRIEATHDPLFGHAGTATAIEYVEGASGFKFHFGTDGSGYDAIIIPDGGARNQVSLKSFETTEIEGKMMNRLQTRMKGMDVFSFGITTAPKSIKKLGEHYGFNYQEADFFVFHQANMKMNNMIIKKLKLDVDKVPSCMYHFGNTSSASIPLTIVSQLKGRFEDRPTKFICCGFGVGLSWGTVAFETENMIVSDLVEVEENTNWHDDL